MTENTTSTSGSAPAAASPKRNDLENILAGAGKFSAINNALNSSRSDDARKTITGDEYKNAYTAEKATETGRTLDEFKAEFNALEPGEQFNALRTYVQAKSFGLRSEAADYLKNNLDEILSEPKNVEDLAGGLKDERSISRLMQITENETDKLYLNEYAGYLQLGKYLKALEEFKDGLKEDSKLKTPDNKRKTGRQLIEEAPQRYREAISREAVSVAVETKADELRKSGKNYGEEAIRAIAQAEQVLAELMPSVDIIKKAAEKVYDKAKKEYETVDSKTRSSRLGEIAKSSIGYALKSGLPELTNRAVDYAFAAYKGKGKGFDDIPYDDAIKL